MKKKASLNIICSILAQLVAIVSGFVVPRLILTTFGSEANGLVSSLTQFLNYISLVEGGLGSVVLASLYSPLAKKNNEKLNGVLKAANRFFRHLSYIFVAYVAVLAVVYPFVVKSNYSWIYIASLTIILAITLFIQYFFSITYKLLLQADHRMYVVQLVQIITTLGNLIIVVLLIHFFPELHIVKLGSALLFIIQPIIYSHYVKKRYHLDKEVEPDQHALSQRWACFGQNLAFFIHNNTDVVVLSLFTNLKLVSVYSVYFLVVSHIKSFFLSFSHAFAPLIGKAIAKREIKKANKFLDIYEFLVFNVATIVFGCCIYLLPNFVLIYTHGVKDIDYYRPIFSTIIIMAEFIYCVRYPYNDLIYSAGKFKETAKSSYVEAAINIVLSIILVINFGLEGIAVGTFIGMFYRMIYFIWFISKNIINRPIVKFIKRMLIATLTLIISPLIVGFLDRTGSATVILWLKNGIICIFVYSILALIFNLVFDNKTMFVALKYLRKKDRQEE